MSTTADRLKYLIDQFAANDLTEAEFAELFNVMGRHEIEVKEVLTAELEAQPPGSYDRLYWAKKFKELNLSKKDGTPPRFVSSRTFRRLAVAASIIFAVAIGAIVIARRGTTKQPQITQTQSERFKNDVDPGKYKARLQLADGRIIVLDSAGVGELTKQGSTAVINKDGQLIYDAPKAPSPLERAGGEVFNTLSTNRGETYATVLADGSKVWLNSASSIKYPVAFNGKERRVEITGEAYFEIKHNDKMPFKVVANGMEVHDLGTEFNVNAYNDEQVIKTTLVSGSAKIVLPGTSVPGTVIKPGQQAVIARTQSEAMGTKQTIQVQTNADIEQAIAWKHGQFDCNGLDISAIMRQVGRWYDVDITMDAGITKDKFAGRIPRTVSLTNLLKVLELNGVRFIVEGKKITVMK